MSREKHSRARLDGVCEYKMWTTEELIEAYMFEHDRVNREDAEITQNAIKKELKRRFNMAMRLMDANVSSPVEVYKYLLNVAE